MQNLITGIPHPTPYYLIDQAALIGNLEILRGIADLAGCRILLAQKAFSMFALYPLIGRYLAGTAASGLYEARLGREEMGGEVHVFAAAFRDDEMDEILRVSDHIVFNSTAQLDRFCEAAALSGVSAGIRINPEHSTQEKAIYDPCAPGSRLGVTADQLDKWMRGRGGTGCQRSPIDGLHFHTLCEQGADALIETLSAVEGKFGHILRGGGIKWVNFGGGHHITRDDYDRAALVDCIIKFREKYGVAVYLEPGEAVALNCGYLVSTILDIVENAETKTAILDASAACHMPDVIEMPYRPPAAGTGKPGEYPHTYRLGGPTCLAGDVIGDYSFPGPLEPGAKVVFADMAIYTMVKNNTFNGMRLPSIILREAGGVRVIREFGYEDFKMRLS